MEVDSRTLDSSGLDADVCIVGAGPAGLTVARALAMRDLRIVLLESGGRSRDPDVQALCDGTTTGDAYAGPGVTRHRQVGGTALIWNTWLGAEMGAKYVPLDAVDFEAREWLPLSGWPFDKASLDPYYERAQSLCGLGPYIYRGVDWASPDRPLLALPSGPLTTDVYQLGPARLFTDVYLQELRQARNVLLCLHATAVDLETDPAGRSVTQVRAARVTGRPLRVRANLFVLAAGGIENARLLLLSNRVRHDSLASESNMVGRCFMEHPRDVACRLTPADPRLLDRCGLYDIHRTAAGVVMGRLTFTDEARRHEQLPAMSVTLQPHPQEFRWRTAESLRTRLLGARRRHLSEWFLLPRKGSRFDAIELLINMEQAPDRDNRVTLGTDRDRYNLPKAVIHWRWRELDQRNLARIRAIVVSELERSGIGRVIIDTSALLDPNAHHHMGTTRMHRDPRLGVVTEEARVHGLSNLFVAGSSVFPTGGFANPTLTIVALALRLAEHLKRQL
jgi:choline dehydrogenase-like flavoprotein